MHPMRGALRLAVCACLVLLSACGLRAEERPPDAGGERPETAEQSSHTQPLPALSPSADEAGHSGSSAAESGGSGVQEGTGEDAQPEPDSATPGPEALPGEIAAAMVGGSWTASNPVALEDLVYLNIPYVDFDGVERVGEMVAHHTLVDDLLEIFAELREAGFPIADMRLIDAFGADDFASMEANNSYCFCSRLILGTGRYSIHSYGAAVDLNPVQNPYLVGASVYPASGAEYLDRAEVRPGMIVEGDVVHTAFTSRGWSWGGDWPNPDYQHFEKEIA